MEDELINYVERECEKLQPAKAASELSAGLGTYSAILYFDGDTKEGVLSPLERMFDSSRNEKHLKAFEGMSEGIARDAFYRVTITIERA